MRTPFAMYLAAVAIAFVLLALLLRSWGLLLVALLPTAILGLAAASPPPRPRLTITRSLSRERAAEGQAVQVSVTVRNDGPTLSMAELFDALSPELRVTEGTNRVLLSIPRGTSIEIAYTVAATVKGLFSVGPLRVRSFDPLGTAFERFDGDATTLSVAPPLEEVRTFRVPTRRTRPWFGQIPSRSIGLGTEFFGIREYVAGDETRRVNWKASARFDRLYSNEYEGERTSDVVIVLDARSEAEVGLAPASTTESGVRAALGLAAAMLAEGNRVGLVVLRNLLDWVYLGYGKKQLHRILATLIRVRPGGAWGLEHVVSVLSRFFPTNVHVLLVTPLVDPGAVGAIASLVSHGREVVVVSPSPVEIEWRMVGQPAALRDAYRLVHMERSNTISALRRYAFVLDWDPVIPLASALKGVERFGRQR